MRYLEIVEGKPQKPLNTQQMQKRAERQRKAQYKINDVIAKSNIDINAARRKLSEI
jgi:Spy/CpxP family protein refolding chaperone